MRSVGGDVCLRLRCGWVKEESVAKVFFFLFFFYAFQAHFCIPSVRIVCQIRKEKKEKKIISHIGFGVLRSLCSSSELRRQMADVLKNTGLKTS